MKIVAGGVTHPEGFQAIGDHIGIKRKRKDLALLYSEISATVATVLTTNVIKAAPILWNQKVVEVNKSIKAIVINSGIANACTGDTGMKNAELMVKKTASCLGVEEKEVLVASTGIIGKQLPIEIISNGIEKIKPMLSNSVDAAHKAAEAIMTTDTFVKEIAVEVEIGGKTVKIGGMAKGSGMIHPNMATMLAFITTDLNISERLLEKALKESVEDSYNMISVDGDTSTNDMVAVLANGAVGNVQICEENKEYERFKEVFHYVNTYLAKQIVKDGEGATKILEVQVKGTATKEDAKKLAKSIIRSNLVKTALFGEDANWGRFIAALGYAGVDFDPAKISMGISSSVGTVLLMEKGNPIEFDEDRAKQILEEKELVITIHLEEGDQEATAWGCDLSYEYVRINGEYRT